jgi:hypothetical protein
MATMGQAEANPSGTSGFDGIAINAGDARMLGGGGDAQSVSSAAGSEADVPAFDFEEAEAPQREAPSFSTSVAGSSSETTRRRPGKGSNPLPQMVGVVLGGLASIPLAQLCLWWIFSTDPVDAGPLVAQYVPFIVPSDFRGTTSVDDEEPDKSESNQASERQANSRRTLLGENDPTPFSPNGNRPRDDSADENSSNDESAGGGLGTNRSIPDVVNQPPEDLRNRSEPVDPMFVGLANPHEQLRKRRKSTADGVYEDFQGVLDGFEVWSEPATGENPSRSEAIDQYYHAMCELGSSLLYVDPDDERAEQAALSIQETMASHFRAEGGKLRRFLGNRAARLLQQPTDLVGNGVAIAGSLVSVERQGDYLASRIRLDDVGRTEVTVYGWLKPPRNFQPGCKVLVLGERISDPQGALELDVDDSEVIAGSFLLILQTSGSNDDRRTVLDDSSDRSDGPNNGRSTIID